MVTPFNKKDYLLNKVVVTIIISVGALVFLYLHAAIFIEIDMSFIVVISIFSHKEIEGFAIMKLLGMIIILPVISLIFTDAKELFFAVVPAFWPAKMISSFIRGDEAMCLIYSLYFWVGLGYAILVNALSYVRFIKKVIAQA